MAFVQLSDGQRKRVQIFMQLLRPSKLILLDEITTDLDIISRADFLEYIKVNDPLIEALIECTSTEIHQRVAYLELRMPVFGMASPLFMQRIFSMAWTIGQPI